MNTIEKDQKYIAHAYHRYPVCFVSGKGSILTDEDGKAVTELAAGTLYELRVTVADGGALDLSETEKEIRLSVVLGK